MIPGVQPGFKSLSMEARRALVCPEIEKLILRSGVSYQMSYVQA
jgi:hypothetical protein